ncbi:hypothetical protein SO802_013959 [Lithocarpus litseifolius]|uniref:Replication protein A 70 kDa DNA-binding subunit B/D first OB fold domain-containing protein n=1 Tax=Lithocarpus litseifolius TaxID=425828 RepID=A0AAW2D9S1_9ROSI
MSYNLIKQLSDKNENWKVRVRLSRMWEAVNRKNLELISLNMVLIDEQYQDDTIHATIQKNNVKKFQAQLREGQLYSLSNFRVDTYKEKDSYRPISKDKKINFLRTIVIEKLKEAEVTISQHKFEFVDYRTIVDRFDNNKQLTDIIGKIVGVGAQENVHVQGSTVPMRNIDIMNPEDIKIRITLWGPTSNEIEDNFYTNNPGPFVIIVTSTIVKTFRGEHYLSSTSATKVYINLEIPETATLIDRNVEKTEIEGIPLQFKQEISVAKRITQNRRTIKQITSLEWTSDDQENVFTCLAKIENIEKTLDGTISDVQSATKKLNLKMIFGVAIAKMNANSTLPNEIEKLIGKTFVFQLKLNDYNWKEGWELYTIEKVFDNISNDETAMKLDHITTEPLQNDEIKETPDQTSDKNTFEVFDTKPSTGAKNDPVEPPKKKPNGDITTEALENYEVKKNADQTSQKNKFEVLDKKPLTSTNNDEKRSKQEHNSGAIPSISSASNVENTEPSDDNMFLRDLINRRKATKHKSSKKKKLQRRK